MKTCVFCRLLPVLPFFLSACQLGNPDPPPVLPAGLVTGFVIGGAPVAGASVLVTGPQGPVGATRTDDNGRFTLPLSGVSGPLVIMARGGSYAGTNAATVNSGTLQGIFSYTPGASVTVAVTDLSTAQAADVAFLEKRGLGVGPALAVAETNFSAWLGFDPATTLVELPDGGPTPLAVGATAHYGLVLAALARIAHEAGQGSELLAQAMADDLANDGLLNGAGAAGAIMLGSTALTTDTYRQGLADALAAAEANAPADSPDSLAGPDALALLAYDRAVAQSDSALFGAAPAPAYATQPLTLSVSPLPDWVHGAVTVTGSVTDPYALQVAITVAVDGQAYQTLTADPAFGFTIDTEAFGDGVNSLIVSATDPAAESAVYQTAIGVDNTPPAACVATFAPLVTSVLVAGQWQDLSGVISGVANGVPINIDAAGGWNVSLLPPLASPIVVSMTDAAGNTQTFTWALSTSFNPAPCPP